jgi:FMN-dependent NADH-azoreductase
MAKVLYVKASARGKRSASITVSDAFVKEYKKHHPDDEIVVMDLFKTKLPPFNASASNGRYAIMSGQEIPEKDRKAWQKIVDKIDFFKSFDKYIFAVAMWNFGIPYVLKHLVDVLTHPGYTFKYESGRYSGLITGKPVFVAFARGGAYEGEASEIDWQKPYFEHALKFIGFSDIQTVVIEPTLAGEDVKKSKTKEAVKTAKIIAEAF